MKLTLIIGIIALVLIAGCTSVDEIKENEAGTIKANNEEASDVKIEEKEGAVEVTVDFDDVEPSENFCVAGSTYEYAGEGGTVDSKVIGLENYKGQEFCKAESASEIDSGAGIITTETTYYFDNTYKEYWIITTVSSPIMPAPQITEIHLIDGEIQ